MAPPPLSELQNHHHHPTLSLFRRKPKMEKSSPPSSSTSTVSPKPRLMRRTRRARNPDEAQSGQGKRSSIYRGVTKHRWTGRYEAHLWDKSCWNPIQNKKGRQVYLGAYEDEEAAAHTYDLAALKYWGPDTILNFPVSTYMKEFQEMQGISREEYLASLRRRSSGFSRGASKYRGVAKHHHNGRWEARIGRVYGNKYLYLGTFNTQEEAAQAYDRAALEYRGPNAVTNFDISRYIKHQRQPQQQQLFDQPLPQPQLFPQPQPQPQPQSQQPIEQFQPQPMEAVVDGPIDQMAAVEPPQEAPIDPGPITGFDNYSSISEPMGDMSWSICMDSGFDNYSNIAMDGPTDLRYFFGGDSFVDDIDCLFEGSGLFGSDADAADGGDGGGGQKVGGILDDSGKIGSGFVGETGQAAEAQGGLTTTATSSQVKSASYPFPISICS